MKFYSYLWLREDGTPYYAGKGHGDRAFTSRAHNLHCPKNTFRIRLFLLPDEVSAFTFERMLIRLFGRKDLGTGCLRNMTDGGEGRAGAIASSETRQKQSAAKKGKPSSWKGKKASPETRLKQSQAAKNRPCRIAGWNKGMQGHPQSKATKAALRKANVGRALSEEHRQKLREAKLGSHGNHTGFSVSNESKRKMSLAKKGKPWTAAQRESHEGKKNGKF